MRSLVGWRKQRTDTTISQGGGQQPRGVVITDPGGQQSIVQLSGDSGDVLLGDGTFGPPAVSGLVWDEDLGNYLATV